MQLKLGPEPSFIAPVEYKHVSCMQTESGNKSKIIVVAHTYVAVLQEL